MSLESARVKVEPEHEAQEFAWSVKREPALGPELLHAPDVACTRTGNSAVGSLSEEDYATETEVSNLAYPCQEHAVMQWLELGPDCIKQEEEMEVKKVLCGISEAAARAGLYAGHAVKDELVLGPELLQAPDIAYAQEVSGSSASPLPASQALAASGASGERPEQRALRTCSVRLERISIEKHLYTSKEQREQSALTAHPQSVTGVLPSKAALEQLKQAPTADRPHQCHVCEKTFKRRDHLKTHSHIHTGEKPNQCDICEKKFIELNSLIIHRRVHTGEKPYACDICHKRFRQLGAVKTHKRVHTGEKPYACDVCNKQLGTLNSLIYHKRTHTGEKPYTCDVCDKQFAGMNSLVGHMRVHTGEKPYACDVCNKKFKRLKSLTSHNRVHTGEKPYTCDICNKRFTQSGNLKKHKRSHTGHKLHELELLIENSRLFRQWRQEKISTPLPLKKKRVLINNSI